MIRSLKKRRKMRRDERECKGKVMTKCWQLWFRLIYRLTRVDDRESWDFRCFVGWRPKVDMWNVMTRQQLKLGYLLCVLHLLESWKDAFHNEIHLTFDYIGKHVYECMDMTVALWFKESHKGEHRFMYHERWFDLHGLSCSCDDTFSIV